MLGLLHSSQVALAVTFYIPEIRPIYIDKTTLQGKTQTETVETGNQESEGEKTEQESQESVTPAVGSKGIDPNFSEVIISGRGEKGDVVRINKDKIPIVTKDKKIRIINRSDVVLNGHSIKMDKSGYFEFHLKLPHEKIQLPVTVKGEAGSEKFQLILTVRPGDVTVKDEDKLEQSPELRNTYSIWLGVGYNYLNYSQDSVAQNIDVGYESFKGPTFLFQAAMWISDSWHLSTGYKTSPGSVTSSPTSTIVGGDYNWTIASVHGTYFDDQWRPNIFGKYKSRIGMIFGVQHHSVPFLARQVGGTGTIKSNTVTMVVGGGKLLIDKGKDWAYEVFMRAQFPVATGDVFNINYRLAFDGSMGAYYNFRSGLRAGVFWYGQYHQYAFTSYDVTVPGYISGNEALLFSTLEGRIGYSF